MDGKRNIVKERNSRKKNKNIPFEFINKPVLAASCKLLNIRKWFLCITQQRLGDFCLGSIYLIVCVVLSFTSSGVATSIKIDDSFN